MALLPWSIRAQDVLPHLGVGIDISSLGVGVQAATAVTSLSNVRAGFNLFNFSHTDIAHGISYDGDLRLRSVQLTWDQYFSKRLGGLHVSAGALIWNGNEVSANANVQPGQVFTLGGAYYHSGSLVTGAGRITLNPVAPVILVGFGNLLPRSAKHFGISAEAGIAFQGTPQTRLNLAGTICANAPSSPCYSASDPVIQSSIQAEQTRLNHDVSGFFRYYPVLSVIFSYKF